MPRPLRRLAMAVLVAGPASVLFSVPAWAPPPPMRPPPPVGIRVHPGNGRAVVRWQPETNDFFPWFPDGYEARTGLHGPFCRVLGVTASTCTIKGLTNGTRYDVRVHSLYTKGVVGMEQFLGFGSPGVRVTPEP
jgi:hypothetical protein